MELTTPDYSKSYTIEAMLGLTLDQLVALSPEEFQKYISPCLTVCKPVEKVAAIKFSTTASGTSKLTPTTALGKSMTKKPVITKLTPEQMLLAGQQQLDAMQKLLESLPK
jgi:hypothetical protein